MWRSVTIENTQGDSWKNVVSAHTAPFIFKIFGHLIESVEWRLAGNRKHKGKLFELLAESYGKIPKKLNITDSPYLNKRNQFPVLEELILYNAEPKHFCLNSPLKRLEILNIEGTYLDNQQPWFFDTFHTWKRSPEYNRNNWWHRFLRLMFVPQIKVLPFQLSKHLTKYRGYAVPTSMKLHR